jgi:sugar transferase (PEP-CTERM/EpsH1 system associated)
MRIFMLVSRVPWPLEKGDKLRAYHQLRFLAKNHEVHLFCLSDSAVHPDALEHLRSITPFVTVYRLNRLKILLRMVLAFFSAKPFQVHYFFDRGIAKKLRSAAEGIRPDAVYCQLIRCSEYVKNWHQYAKTLDFMDALSAGQQRRAARAPWYIKLFVKEEAKRLTAYEHLIFDYFEHHSIISEQDRRLIYHPNAGSIRVIPNGIDSSYFLPNMPVEKQYDVLFTGNMSYPPNVEGACRLVNEVLPLVKKKLPNIRVLIAGANPSQAVRALAGPAVTVSGWLEDMREAYSSSAVFVAPMQSGSGMQNKLLEAMCMEVPCVTTSLAAEPIGARHQQECLVGNTNEQLAEHIVGLLNDGKEASRLSKNGRLFVTQQFDWAKTVADLDTLMFGK